jgi:hypothetical protein
MTFCCCSIVPAGAAPAAIGELQDFVKATATRSGRSRGGAVVRGESISSRAPRITASTAAGERIKAASASPATQNGELARTK